MHNAVELQAKADTHRHEAKRRLAELIVAAVHSHAVRHDLVNDIVDSIVACALLEVGSAQQAAVDSVKDSFKPC